MIPYDEDRQRDRSTLSGVSTAIAYAGTAEGFQISAGVVWIIFLLKI